MTDKVVVLDAMGVLYRHGDDVADILIPYVREQAGQATDDEIVELYRQCSLGQFSSAELWRRLGLAASADDQLYCERHQLMPGMADLLASIANAGLGLACLSNDVLEWSMLLRRRFRLDARITTWVISGEIGLRKPDPASYRELLTRLGCSPADVLFVDDRPSNVAAAEKLGIAAVSFTTVEELESAIRKWGALGPRCT